MKPGCRLLVLAIAMTRLPELFAAVSPKCAIMVG